MAVTIIWEVYLKLGWVHWFVNHTQDRLQRLVSPLPRPTNTHSNLITIIHGMQAHLGAGDTHLRIKLAPSGFPFQNALLFCCQAILGHRDVI